MTLPESKNEQAREQATRFYHLAGLLSEQSLMEGKDLGIRVDKDGYSFWFLTPKGWEERESDRYFQQVELDGGLSLELTMDAFSWEDGGDQLWERDGLFDDEMFAEQEEKPKPPQIVLMGNGEQTPFRLEFREDKKVLWVVKGNELGEYTLAQPDEDDA